MKKISLLRLALTISCNCGLFTLLLSQEAKSNLIEIKYNINYFKGYRIESIHNYPSPNISYTRFLSNSPYSVTVEFDELFIYYKANFEEKGPGFLTERNALTLEVMGGYSLELTPKASLIGKVGAAYRSGWETKYLYTIQHQFWSEMFTRRDRYYNPGVSIAFQYLLYLSNRWAINCGGSYQYFLSRITTNHHLNINAGIGFLF